METSNITRLEVISQHGRELVHYNLKDVTLQLQDDNRTLKIFVTTSTKK